MRFFSALWEKAKKFSTDHPILTGAIVGGTVLVTGGAAVVMPMVQAVGVAASVKAIGWVISASVIGASAPIVYQNVVAKTKAEVVNKMKENKGNDKNIIDNLEKQLAEKQKILSDELANSVRAKLVLEAERQRLENVEAEIEKQKEKNTSFETQITQLKTKQAENVKPPNIPIANPSEIKARLSEMNQNGSSWFFRNNNFNATPDSSHGCDIKNEEPVNITKKT